MRRIISILFLISIISPLKSQITINESDMPVAGDTIRVSYAQAVTLGQTVPTGTDTTWDYTSLTPYEQHVKEYIDIVDLPITYQTVFNNPFDPEHQASYATPEGDTANIPNMQLSEPYTFFQKNSSAFGVIGYGVKLNGFPIPGEYDSLDLMYSFPMNYGDQFSSHSISSQNVPGLGFVQREIKRHNFVDGWGSLKTPYGTFDVLRVRSEILQRDSIKFDSLPPFPALVTNKVEYKFIGKNHGISLLTIEKENGFITDATYIDSVRSINTSVDEISQNNFTAYPNPFSGYINIQWEKDYHSMTIYSVSGQLIYRKNIEALKQTRLDGEIHPKPGVYIIELQGDDIISRQKVIKTK